MIKDVEFWVSGNSFKGFIELHSDELFNEFNTRIAVMDLDKFMRHYFTLVSYGKFIGTFDLNKESDGFLHAELIGNEITKRKMNELHNQNPESILDISSWEVQGWFGYDKPLVDFIVGRKYKIRGPEDDPVVIFNGYLDEDKLYPDPEDPNPRKDFYYEFITDNANRAKIYFYYNGVNKCFKYA